MTGSYIGNLVRVCLTICAVVSAFLPAAYAVNSAAKNTGVVMREANGLHGMLILTSDKDWQQKWDTPEKTIPKFNTSSELYIGETLSVLGFVSNPKLDDKGEVNIHCGLQLVTPTGKVVVSQTEIPCMTGKMTGKAANVYMLPAGAAVMAELTDEEGNWTAHYRITDKNRQTTIELKSSFELIHAEKPKLQEPSNQVIQQGAAQL
jgi:hypothetical protein